MDSRYRTAALAITAVGSLAILAGTADAHVLAGSCDAVTAIDYPEGVQSRVIVDVAVNGAVVGTVGYDFEGQPGPLAIPYRAPPFAGDPVEVSASSTGSDGFVLERTLLFSSRACGSERPSTLAPPVPEVGVVILPPAKPRVTKPQKPRLTCAQLRKRHAGNFSLFQRHCAFPKRPPIVAGEYRRAQGPAPGTIVSRLLSVVPALAEDVPGPVSSISQSAGGTSATGTMDAAERGRLVPRVIPGHPWTTRSTSPHRGVVASVTWRSGRLVVSVLYSASRGRSTTSVSAR